MSDKPKYEFPTDFDSLSWKELALKLSYYLSSALVHSQHAMNSETLHDALGCCNQVSRRVIAERAAPPEDVRAVVDEPVAVLKRGPLLPLTARFLAPALDLPFGDHPLYRHPQRPMVLPERRAVSEHARDQAMCANAWNSCLDEISRLNK